MNPSLRRGIVEEFYVSNELEEALDTERQAAIGAGEKVETRPTETLQVDDPVVSRIFNASLSSEKVKYELEDPTELYDRLGLSDLQKEALKDTKAILSIQETEEQNCWGETRVVVLGVREKVKGEDSHMDGCIFGFYAHQLPNLSEPRVEIIVDNQEVDKGWYVIGSNSLEYRDIRIMLDIFGVGAPADQSAGV